MTNPFDEILTALGSSQVHVDDLPEADPRATIGRTCEAIFTGGVDWLRSSVPNDRVRAIARVIWDLVGHKQVLVAIGPDVPTLSFTVMRLRGVIQGLVLIPKRWPALVEEDGIMQLGAILYVGVQVVDFYNDRLIGDETAAARCDAYEAELLHTLARILPAWSPNDHQRQIMDQYPAGLDSPGVEAYDYRPYAPARGSA